MISTFLRLAARQTSLPQKWLFLSRHVPASSTAVRMVSLAWILPGCHMDWQERTLDQLGLCGLRHKKRLWKSTMSREWTTSLHVVDPFQETLKTGQVNCRTHSPWTIYQYEGVHWLLSNTSWLVGQKSGSRQIASCPWASELPSKSFSLRIGVKKCFPRSLSFCPLCWRSWPLLAGSRRGQCWLQGSLDCLKRKSLSSWLCNGPPQQVEEHLNCFLCMPCQAFIRVNQEVVEKRGPCKVKMGHSYVPNCWGQSEKGIHGLYGAKRKSHRSKDLGFVVFWQNTAMYPSSRSFSFTKICL